MNNNVLVKIRGLQTMQGNDNDSECVEVISSGKCRQLGNKTYVKYEEAIEDSKEISKNIIKISDNCVEVSRGGMGMGSLTFLKDSRTVSCYSTEFGTLSLGIYTSEFIIEKSEGKILIKLKYALDMNDDYVSDNTVQIEIIDKIKPI